MTDAETAILEHRLRAGAERLRVKSRVLDGPGI
jgi:hypothetical protein